MRAHFHGAQLVDEIAGVVALVDADPLGMAPSPSQQNGITIGRETKGVFQQHARRQHDTADHFGRRFCPQRRRAVAITGRNTTGVAVCNHVRSFDIAARVRAGTARYVETLDEATVNEIIARVISAIDPSGQTRNVTLNSPIDTCI